MLDYRKKNLIVVSTLLLSISLGN